MKFLYILSAIASTACAAAVPVAEPQAEPAAAAAHGRTGDGTWYTPGLGACGWTNSESDAVIAIGGGLYDKTRPSPSAPSSLCGKRVKISYKGKSTTAKIVDYCGGCKVNDIDMSPAVFKHFAPKSKGRIFNVHWEYI